MQGCFWRTNSFRSGSQVMDGSDGFAGPDLNILAKIQDVTNTTGRWPVRRKSRALCELIRQRFSCFGILDFEKGGCKKFYHRLVDCMCFYNASTG